ncbi:MAG: YheV family putative metal-binding protein [Pseudomonadales bacterium]
MATRKFIAGAVCPECRQMDRIVLEDGDGQRRRRCVNCGHTDTMASGSAIEPTTRVTGRPLGEVPAASVRIVDPRRGDTRKPD